MAPEACRDRRRGEVERKFILLQATLSILGMIICECHPLLQVSHRDLSTGLNSMGPGDSESSLDFTMLS